MAVVTGKDGDLKIGTAQLPEVHSWSFKPQITAPEYASNKTGGAKKIITGVKSGSGSIGIYWDPADVPLDFVDVGTGATLKGYITATQFYSIPMVVVSYSLDVNIDAGEIIKSSFEYKTNGVWTNPTEAMRYGGMQLAFAGWEGNHFGNYFCPQLLPRYIDEDLDSYLDRIASYRTTIEKCAPNRELASQIFMDRRLDVHSPDFDTRFFDEVVNYITRNSIALDTVTLDRVEQHYRQYTMAS